MKEDVQLDQTSTQLIYAVVRQIPFGKVASYGQVARIAGHGIQARQVGYALAALKSESDVPWQRVINAQGRISLPGVGGVIQKKLLDEEGVEFDDQDRVDFWQFGWDGPGG
jgi:methylated-DNA-protein-cysteine methyltransferase related protein